MLVVDLFSGTGAATKAFKDRGHKVITVDIDPKLRPDIVADIRHFPLRNLKPDFVWASPPCTEFSRRDQRGLFPNEPHPDLGLQLVAAACDAIAGLDPTYWCIENVRGAKPYLGRPTKKVKAWYLWGRFPPFDAFTTFQKHRLPGGGKKSGWRQASARSRTPFAISLALCMAFERGLA